MELIYTICTEMLCCGLLISVQSKAVVLKAQFLRSFQGESVPGVKILSS